MTTVKRYRGVLDFYFQRGQQIVRSWPKKSNLVPTPAQKVQRDNFRAIECCLKAQGPQQRAAWQRWRPYFGQNWVDYVHRVWMGPASRGHLWTFPDILLATVGSTPGGNRFLDVFWEPVPGAFIPLFDVIFTDAHGKDSLWGWHVYDYKIQRGRFRQPRWAPSIPEPRRMSASYFSPWIGWARFYLFSACDGVIFSFVDNREDENDGLLVAAQYAPAVL